MVEPSILTSIDQEVIDIMEEYINESEEVMDDEFFGESYDKEWALKDQGKWEGKIEGRKEEKLEIAKKMKERNIALEEIEICTGLTIDEINNL